MREAFYVTDKPACLIQRDRDIERLSHGDIQKTNKGDNNDTQETDEVPFLAATVKTLPEAVAMAIDLGLGENCMFHLSRAIKAFEITTKHQLPPAELLAAFNLWWNTAQPLLPPGVDYDEFRFDFQDTFAKTRSALGSNSLEEAIRRAKSTPLPMEANAYTSPRLKLLVAVCYHLQRLQGASPIIMSVRNAAAILGESNLNKANAKLNGLVRDGLLVLVTKGDKKLATRYRFIFKST